MHKKPTKKWMTEAEALDFWSCREELEPEDWQDTTDSILEWLSDKGYLTSKGLKLRHAYWYKYIYDDETEDRKIQ